MAFLSLVILLASAPPVLAETSASYRCLDGTAFHLRASATMATVQFSDGVYRLPRRPSSLAVKYATRTATLYLDGEFAAFIADDRPLPGCYRMQPDGTSAP